MAQNWDGLTEHEVFPGFHGRFIHSERMSFVRWRIEAGAPLPEHSHPHEQVAHVYAGEFEIVVSGVTRRLQAGDVAAIPPGAVHSGRAITACDIMDAFAPVREDYLKFG
jgi:quercetin dioxygenase-like cupin family protein